MCRASKRLAWLCEALEELGLRAERLGVPLLIEPLNRYETNLLNRVEDGLAVLDSLRTRNVKLLCDLFHMNIEEESIAESLRLAGKRLGARALCGQQPAPRRFWATSITCLSPRPSTTWATPALCQRKRCPSRPRRKPPRLPWRRSGGFSGAAEGSSPITG